MKSPHGKIIFIVAIIYFILGLLNWPSQVSRGPAKQGIYEERRIVLKEKAVGYNDWTEQLKRKDKRGR